MLKINCINYSTLALLLLMVGCRYTSENQCGAPYDMPTYVEVLVTDFNGKPLPNKVDKLQAVPVKILKQRMLMALLKPISFGLMVVFPTTVNFGVYLQVMITTW